MNFGEKINSVYRTYNYKVFKYLPGNRDVTPGRVSRLKKSYQKIGQIEYPILVNEKFEVIEGQGRLEACKELHLPIVYIQIPGLGIKECQAMNINQSNWSTIDYVKSYAELGIQDYQYFLQLYKAYKPLGIRVVLHSVSLEETIQGGGGKKYDSIKKGTFVCTTEDYEKAMQRLELANQFSTLFDGMLGNSSARLNAVIDCGEIGLDMRRLYKRLQKDVTGVEEAATTLQAIQAFEQIYNYRLSDKVYLETEYDKWKRNLSKSRNVHHN